MDPTTSEQIVQAILALLGMLITTYVVPVLYKQAKLADEKLDASWREALYPALLNAISYATGALKGDDQAKLAASAQLKAHVVETATNYVQRLLPDTLEKLGVTETGLRDLLAARLQQAIDLAKTPAAPAPTV